MITTINEFKVYESKHLPKFKVGDEVYFKTLSDAMDYFGVGVIKLNKLYKISDSFWLTIVFLSSLIILTSVSKNNNLYFCNIFCIVA